MRTRKELRCMAGDAVVMRAIRMLGTIQAATLCFVVNIMLKGTGISESVNTVRGGVHRVLFGWSNLRHGETENVTNSQEPVTVLDVGCGQEGVHFVYEGGDHTVHVDIDPNASHLEAVCDALNLPFTDNAFAVVRCSNVIEHLKNPYRAVEEFKRVSSSRIVVKVPNGQFFKCVEHPEHLYSWNPCTFKTFLEQFGDVEVFLSHRWMHTEGVKTSFVKKWISRLIYFLFGPDELTGVIRLETG